jgi:putative endonuclease
MTERRARLGRAAQAGGVQAEALACAALRADGWEVLGQRLRTAAGEIDVVARRGPLVVFVEVKARPTLLEAAYALTARQSRRLSAAATILLADHPEWGNGDIRFDALLVDAAGRVRRVIDIVRSLSSEI